MFTIGSERHPKEISLISLVYLTRLCVFPILCSLTPAQACFSALDQERAFRQEVSYGPAQFCFDTRLLA